MRSALCLGIGALLLVTGCKKKGGGGPGDDDDDDNAGQISVFLAAPTDLDGDGAFSVSTLARGGLIYSVSDELGAGHNVTAAVASPPVAGMLALLVDGNATPGLYVMSATGGNVVHIAADVTDVVWRPDGMQLAFVAGDILYVAPADGSASPTALTSSETVRNGISYSPSGQTIAYRSDIGGLDHFLLRTVGNDGSNPQTISSTAAAAGTLRITSYLWSPIDDTLLYRQDPAVEGQYELFTASADGSTAVQVSVEAGSTGPIAANAGRWMADGEEVAFTRDATSTGTRALWLAAADGSGVTKVSVEVAQDVTGFDESFNGDLLYKLTTTELYVADTSVATDGFITQFDWMPDGSRFAYIGAPAINGPFTLYTVPAGGGAPVQISDPAAEVDEFFFSLTTLFYETIGDGRLYAADPTGANPVVRIDANDVATRGRFLSSDADVDRILFEQYVGPVDNEFLVERIWAEVTTPWPNPEFGRSVHSYGFSDLLDLRSLTHMDMQVSDTIHLKAQLRALDGVLDFAKQAGPATYPDNYSQNHVLTLQGNDAVLASRTNPGQVAVGPATNVAAPDGSSVSFDFEITETSFGGQYSGTVEPDPNTVGAHTISATYQFMDPGGESVVYGVTGALIQRP